MKFPAFIPGALALLCALRPCAKGAVDLHYPDRSFNSTGSVVANAVGHQVLRAVKITADGGAVAAGRTAAVSGTDWLIVKSLADGTPDPSFGTNGVVTVNFSNGTDEATGLVVRSDGKIVVAGAAGGAMGVARLLANGTLDSTFSGDGLTTVSAGTLARANAVALSGNKIVLAGYSSTAATGNQFTVVRLLADGSLDTGFSGDGIATKEIAPGTAVDEANALAVLADGSVVLAGRAVLGTVDVALAKFTTLGAVDTAFGSAGAVTTDVRGGTGLGDVANALVIQPDGKLIIAGGGTTGADTRQIMVRYSPAGVLDSSFGTGGRIVLAPRGNFDTATAAVLTSDGYLHTAGHSGMGGELDFMMTRSINGVPDAGFGTGGIAYFPIGGVADTAHGMDWDGCKTVIAGGSGATVGDQDLALLRLGRTPNALENWRAANFGTFANAGPAADDADPDNDGLTNLVEYGFSLNPQVPDSGNQPVWVQMTGGMVQIVFPDVPAVGAVAERSTTLEPGSWTPVPDSGTPGYLHFFMASSTDPRTFYRVRFRGNCGNGTLEGGEACDDGNDYPGDGCSAVCQVESCVNASQCPDDNNPCTTAVCSAGVCSHVFNTATCDDGNPCTLNDVCSLGVCVSGTARICNDNNPCTTDACLPTGGCSYTPVANGTACNDNTACTSGDSCQSGVCTGTAVTCPDDANVCTTAACHPVTGCYQAANTAPCDDGNACTLNDVCAGGLCSAGTLKDCSDGNPCTNDLCSASTGACSYAFNTASCNDNNPCTTGDVCSSGVCRGTGTVNCDDGNPCTTDSCQPGVGCVHTSVTNGTACNDNSVCTTGDSCQSGVCIGGSTISCPDDGNVCTIAACHPATGCYQTNNSASCNDGNACTLNDACSGGVCSGTAKNCSDSNPCTNDLCNATTGACFYTNNTASCSDGNPCTTGDTCAGGACQPGTGSLNCDDNNPCTADSCNPAGGCVHTANNAAACSDNNVCTTGDHCQSGACVGTAVTCPNDSNVCTTAACNPVTGCYQAANTAPCDDGNLCTLNDFCSGSVCRSGTAKNCSDSNSCTDDLCNATTGACFYTNNTASCSDGNPCSTGDFCSSGSCQPGSTPVVCNDNNPCTADSCQPGVGCVFTPVANGTACNDNSVCTTGDSCQSGVCTGGSTITCPDDGNACTTAACHPVTGCYHANNSAPCDDGSLCTLNDFCSGGICRGTAVSCNDSNPCTDDFCNATTGACIYTNNTASCSDSNACTSGDFCSLGVCQSGSPVVCNDNIPCTSDSCQPVTGCTYTPIPGCIN